MSDKYVRRRRTVLGIFVVAVLVVVTSIFGAAASSPLHPVQQGISKVLTPVGHGVAKIFSPVNDLSGWVSSTLHAKSENGELRKLNAQYDAEIGQAGIARADTAQLQGLERLNAQLGLSQDGPVFANVSEYNPQVFYEAIGIDEGRDDGIRIGDPVISQAGLVGDISSVSADSSTVAGLSSPKMGVEVQIDDAAGEPSRGTVQPEPGDLRALQVTLLPTSPNIAVGDRVTTSSYSQPNNPLITSPYPSGIPVGVVSSADQNQIANDSSVDITPDADLQDVDEIEVLAHVPG